MEFVIVPKIEILILATPAKSNVVALGKDSDRDSRVEAIYYSWGDCCDFGGAIFYFVL